jgi:hypothetical protein
MGENGLSIADALALARDNDGNFGGNGLWWIIILALFFGWGGNGNWGNNGRGNGDTIVVPGGFGYGNSCCCPATTQGMTDAFNFQTMDSDIRGTHDSVVDGFYQNNLAITNLGTAIANSFANSDKANLQSFATL